MGVIFEMREISSQMKISIIELDAVDKTIRIVFQMQCNEVAFCEF